jgi:hypothetical protein
MGKKRVFTNYEQITRCMVLAALATMILSGCGSLFGGGEAKSSNSTLWKHRDQFVRIEAQDRGNGPTAPNDQPVKLSAEQIRLIFGTLDAKFTGDETPSPMFTEKELDILADAISNGLAVAQPRQDVTFAIVGIHRGFYSFTSDRQYVSGRVFYKDGKLNLIIGSLHEPYYENLERRLYPLEPGTREFKEPDPRLPAPPSWKPVPEAGLETPVVAGIKRYDWLVLNPDPQLWKSAAAEKKEAKETAKDAFREASEVRESSAQMEAEQQKLKTEIEQMKQTIEEMKQAPAPAAPKVAPAVVPAATSSADLKKIEDRLEVLQKIRDKGWITEQEFQAKKQEILDSL